MSAPCRIHRSMSAVAAGSTEKRPAVPNGIGAPTDWVAVIFWYSRLDVGLFGVTRARTSAYVARFA